MIASAYKKRFFAVFACALLLQTSPARAGWESLAVLGVKNLPWVPIIVAGAYGLYDTFLWWGVRGEVRRLDQRVEQGFQAVTRRFDSAEAEAKRRYEVSQEERAQLAKGLVAVGENVTAVKEDVTVMRADISTLKDGQERDRKMLSALEAAAERSAEERAKLQQASDAHGEQLTALGTAVSGVRSEVGRQAGLLGRQLDERSAALRGNLEALGLELMEKLPSEMAKIQVAGKEELVALAQKNKVELSEEMQKLLSAGLAGVRDEVSGLRNELREVLALLR